ncbi:gastrin/cholecystokinin type B receptor-like [Schistocerca serialis cubense]|uniref:gastrin/cholecystokinin type B receptor-like n=2 Tax=Schistocerca TaxID=7008 RepID=UPI00214DF418|nr:gastrin/cholecystokinin type B receptor-like [Schistocerca serialis cubense]
MILCQHCEPLSWRQTSRHKCREEWPSADVERAYNLFLDVALLLVPLLLMAAAYSLVVSKLWRGLRREIRTTSSTPSSEVAPPSSPGGRASCLRTLRRVADQHQHHRQRARPPPVAVSLVMHERARCLKGEQLPTENGGTVCSVLGGRASAENSEHYHDQEHDQEHAHAHAHDHDHDSGEAAPGHALRRQAIRSNYARKSIEAKRKVIRMLFVVVAEFFVCWTPLHVLNTWYLFNPDAVYAYVGRTGISLVQLVAYVSCCCHPITYCFMNRRFRAAFLGAFRCPRRRRSTLCRWWESSNSPGHSPCQTPTARIRKQVSCSGIHMVQNDQTMRTSTQLPPSLFPEAMTNE